MSLMPVNEAHLPPVLVPVPEEQASASSRSSGRRGATELGFTLLELLLGIAIASVILLAAMVFAEEAARSRDAIQAELQVVSAARLILGHLTLELEGAARGEGPTPGLTGGPDRIEFVTTRALPPSSWSTLGAPQHDQYVVGYRPIGGDAAAGAREEGELDGAGLDLPATAGVESEVDGVAEARQSAITGLERTERRRSAGANGAETAALALTDRLHFIRLSYFDGSRWRDAWNASDLPVAVDIQLGAKPLPEGLRPEEYPYSLFRRTIYLPTGGREGHLPAAQVADEESE